MLSDTVVISALVNNLCNGSNDEFYITFFRVSFDKD